MLMIMGKAASAASVTSNLMATGIAVIVIAIITYRFNKRNND